MEIDRKKVIEDQISDLKRRWPPHSAPPAMWQQLEDLENQLEEISKTETGGRGQ